MNLILAMTIIGGLGICPALSLDNGSGQPWTVAAVHRGVVLLRDTARAAWVERATEGLALAHPYLHTLRV